MRRQVIFFFNNKEGGTLPFVCFQPSCRVEILKKDRKPGSGES